MDKQAKKSLFQDLWDRRFFQFSFSYILGAWGMIQLMEWIVKRYGLASSWVDFTLSFLILFLPAVLMIIYFHGRKGLDRWRPVEKVFIPVNLIAAFALAFFFAPQSQATAMSSKVTVITEEGEKIERFVPNKNFTNHLLAFPFKNLAGPAENWMSLALPLLLSSDLKQDDRIYSTGGISIRNQIESYNFKLDDDIPLSIRREISKDESANQFISGTINKEADTYSISVKANATIDGKETFAKEYEGNDLFGLVDEISSDYKKVLYANDNPKNRKVDLPCSNLYTGNIEAFKWYVEGVKKMYSENEVADGIQQLEKAVALDPNFTMGFFLLSNGNLRLNQIDAAKEDINKSMASVNNLPERMQFNIKAYYYSLMENQEKRIALVEMWRQLYPTNYEPYGRLMNMYSRMAKYNKAKEIAEKAIEAGFEEKALAYLAQLEAFRGNHEQAKAYNDRYAKAFPEKAKKNTQMLYLYIAEGKFLEAQALSDQILLLNPNDKTQLTARAQIEQALGNSAGVIAYYDKALASCNSARDSSGILYSIHSYYGTTGQIEMSNTYRDQWKKISSTFMTPFEIDKYLTNFFYLTQCVDSGKTAEITEEVNAFAEKYQKAELDISCVLKFNLGAASENADLLLSILEGCKEELTKNIGAYANSLGYGYYHKSRKEWDKAIENFDEFKKATGLSTSYYNLALGQIYNGKGDYKTAIKLLEDLLVIMPSGAKVLMELGISYQKSGDAAKAKENFEKAAKLWEKADAEFIPAQRLKKLLMAY